ncbi:MAG TPA: L-threonylcarbamoyladenylate synthase [Paludibacteraceae bacterium]|jgi:tRNA threonylcarbamoyl adenosine modification protein (Sua5/YciO/YrdC/YwlC family)|nr:L-threonylcarbamoyladenylate synthase [Paludibacteraceae bacterium]HRS67342.1 L-threonylcarbamoyladenylate synthase [Paludibacteraceae bacterium]
MLKIYPENPNPKAITRVAEILRNGGIVIYPTDTVYAIGCDIFQPRAVEKVCKLRGIDPQKTNLSLICYDLSNISEYAKVDNATFKLLKHNLPGAFTFILHGSNKLPKLFKNRKTVGIRVPDNNIIRALVKELGNPILTASLKDEHSMSEYETDPELLKEKYRKSVDLIINGGFGGIVPSTIVDCTGNEPVIVREGAGVLV